MVRCCAPFRILVVCIAVVGVWLTASPVRAEDMIIKRPGDHPVYSVEIEPHLVAAFFLPTAGSNGFGLGGRFTIPIVKNGFVSSINNSVGIGFGLDWVHYNGCYYWHNPYYPACSNLNSIWLPVVMQWNFFLSTHWSVFGEPGLAINYNSWGAGCSGVFIDNNRRVEYACPPAPNRVDLNPFVLFIGGRYHFSETTALTMRIGWPYASIGVSFMP
jgi:hypothetical protein